MTDFLPRAWEQPFWTITLSLVGGIACSLLGCFLLLKRMSLLTDAISHGVLPGIALSVLIAGEISPLGIILGAILFGWLTAWLAQSLHSSGEVPEDSSLGVASTAMFALGLVFIKAILPRYDLDLSCTFFGSLELAYTQRWLDTSMPRALPGMLVGLMLTVVFLTLFWKELKLATFDPGLAEAMGFRPRRLHYALVGLVALNTVTSFEAVGSVIVLSMFVAPAGTARLLTDRLVPTLLWAVAASASAAVLGYVLGGPSALNANLAGMIAMILGLQFIIALLAAPRHGLIARWGRRFQLTLRIAREEILGTCFRRQESGQAIAPLILKDHGLSPTIVRWASRQLARQGLLIHTDKGPGLTDAGFKQAASLVRSHRLWEAYLEKNFDLPISHLHDSASQAEHFIGPEVQQELVETLDAPGRDPHGRDIP